MNYRAAALLLLLAATPGLGQTAAERAAWTRPTAPFRMIGNVFYVGTEGLSAFLIADPKGLVLIDGGLPESAPMIAANVRRLGYRLRDVRYLLINHAHYDHAGGLAVLKRQSGAALVASAGDRPDLIAGRTIGRPELDRFPPVRPDRVIRDGERLRVGGTVLTANLTPGHTPGCTSWSTTTRDGAGRPVTVLFACSLTVAGERLVADGRETPAARAFRATFAKLRRMRADVFVNFHPGPDFAAKRTRLSRGDARAFVDPGELPRQVDRAERAFAADLARQRTERSGTSRE